ncbi:DNA ligase I [Truncatella angustata]|uniref:DNA ligase n=1 Tax=Truncatella angustata TaxID=152316 RepID=A0A9P8UTM1_9PEZI|nr:DNA ligase I [Truncatella angustata]KAH6658139.1 DNA ligase I [Truncatella angustata]
MSQQKRKTRDAGAEDEELRQYAPHGGNLDEIDELYPMRPRNHGRTLLFSELFQNLFNPLNENTKRPSGPQARRGRGNRGAGQPTPHEQRRHIIERFISRWRNEVGDDFYPALRLILPNQDRDRGTYGLKENSIGKLLVRVMKIDKNSEDGYALLHWKLPGQSKASRLAGDFAGRCYEVIAKRPMRTKPGDMRVADVNELLDKLSAASGEAEQLPIFEMFYDRMNPDELMWLIRIILKQMKVGATERTFLGLWHPNAEALFNVSSSLRRVCWELHDPTVLLNDDDASIALMQIFQPQLAQFQLSGTFKRMIEKLTGDNSNNENIEASEYWIEEKLDGERMQMHMEEDPDKPGGYRFGWWSRKAKDYSYLYGTGYRDHESGLTQHLKNAFAPGVRNIVLDGEMITWDMQLDKIMAFGTLKSAVIAGKRNPYDEVGARAIYRVFDIVYLNDQDLTRYTLRDRRNALEKAVPGVHRRLELHRHTVATSPDEIEPQLRDVIESASEGLVLKNPRSVYSLNQRNDDWIKVKPEYTDEFGSSVDVVVIGAYYGTGHRGGGHSSFLCGLRVAQDDIDHGADPEKCFSFIRVGGGLRAQDYREIAARTEGKWMDWNAKRPPVKYIELAGGDRQYWKPDQWIRPKDSLVIEVKAASSGPSEQYAKQVTLRFPRFKSIRDNREWNTGLDWQTFNEMKEQDLFRQKEKTLTLDRGRRQVKRIKRELSIAGQEPVPAIFAGPSTSVFEGLEFCVFSDSSQPKKSKTQLETLIKANGGKISQRAIPGSEMILIGEKKVVKVASLIKAGPVDIIRPKWLLDCVAQSDASNNFLLPFEPRHLFHVSDAMNEQAQGNVDRFGDSYARDLGLTDLRNLLQDIPKDEVVNEAFDGDDFMEQLEEHGHDIGNLKGHIFKRVKAYFATTDNISDITALKCKNWLRFGSGKLIDDPESSLITHIVMITGDEETAAREFAGALRRTISGRAPMPRLVTQQWLEESWEEGTRLDEERYAPR